VYDGEGGRAATWVLASDSYESYAWVVTSPGRDELPISEARDHLTEVVGQATYTGQITYITKRGRRVGAIVPVEVAEAAEAAEDAYLSRLARDAEAELAAGAPTRTLSEVVAELDLGSISDQVDEGVDGGTVPAPRGESTVTPEHESRWRP
jgi:prevent-host-death family protein